MKTALRGMRQPWAVRIPIGHVALDGDLSIPESAHGIVLFAHGSGSGRHSPRNQFVAQSLRRMGLATLLFDLLTPREEATEKPESDPAV